MSQIKDRILKLASQKDSEGASKASLRRWEIIEQLAELIERLHSMDEDEKPMWLDHEIKSTLAKLEGRE